MTTRYGLIGTGHRSQMYLEAMTGAHADVAEVVALFDTNPGRMSYYQERFPALASAVTRGPDALEETIAELGIERMVVTSMDRFHADHVVRSLEAGADVVVEKPLTIDAPSARRIAEAAERTGRNVTVTFNYRYSPRNSALKDVIASGRIGRPLSVVFEWVLDTSHGADYFRRWHRDKVNNGGLFVHKSSHHFDLASWWLDDTPTRVYARGDVKFYGKEAAARRGVTSPAPRGTHDGPHGPFELDMRDDERLKALYLDQEQHDGYIRDKDVFSEGVTTEDTLTAIVDYDSGVIMTYALNAHNPWEGYRVAINGTEGRAELEVVERPAVIKDAADGGVVDPSAVAVGDEDSGARHKGEHLIVQRHFEKAVEVEIPEGVGSHGGGDALMLAEVFDGYEAAKPGSTVQAPPTDPLGRASTWKDGLRAISIGICGNESMATGLPIDVHDHMGLDVRVGTSAEGPEGSREGTTK
jgi:predicted dehydrogenase